MTLTKSWLSAVAGDTTLLVISGDQVTDGPVLALARRRRRRPRGGNGIRWLAMDLAETLGVSNVGNYTASLACTANGSPLTVTGNTITMPNEAVTCTFTTTGVTNAVGDQGEIAGITDPGLFNLLVNGTVVAECR